MITSDKITTILSEIPFINAPYILSIINRHYRLFLACFLPVAVITLIYLMIVPHIYESRAVVQVQQREERSIQPMDKPTDDENLTSEDSLKTIEQNLQSYDLFVDVVSNPKIANDPEFLVGYHGWGNSPQDLADWLQANTTVALRHGTRLIDVTVDHQVPAMAQKLAQALVDSFVVMNNQDQSSSQQAALKILVTESEQVKQNLQK
jgi:uncharacterized protein involved in exopolysaccharide biosynthesis